MRERPCYGAPIFPFIPPPAYRPQLPLLSCYHAPPPSSCDLSLNPSSCCCRRRTPDTRLPLFRPSLSPSVFVSSIAMSRSPMRRWTDGRRIVRCRPIDYTQTSNRRRHNGPSLPHFIFVSRFMFPFCYFVVRQFCVGAPAADGGLIFFRLGLGVAICQCRSRSSRCRRRHHRIFPQGDSAR